MKKLSKILFIFVVMISLVGCGSKNERENSKLEAVNDASIVNELTNKIVSLEDLSKTKEAYEKGKISAKDYTEDDRIRYGVDYNIGRVLTPVLTQEELNELKTKGIENVSSYIELKDVTAAINNTFENSVKEQKTVEGCPKFTYESKSKRYYLQTECTMEDATAIVSKVDKITKLDNKYYVAVYAGLSDGNIVYGDFNKEKQIRLLNENESFEITDEDKEQFTKFKYTFEKNGNGDFIFKSIDKE